MAVPFSRYFYFKKDTPANTDWKIKIKERGGVPAKELGPYNAYGKNAWNDELLVKEKHMVEPEYIINQLVKDARVSVTEDGVVVQDESTRIEGVEMPLPRTTEADLNKDLRRLDRLLDRTLYLVVKSKDTQLWGFPSGELLVGRTYSCRIMRTKYEYLDRRPCSYRIPYFATIETNDCEYQ